MKDHQQKKLIRALGLDEEQQALLATLLSSPEHHTLLDTLQLLDSAGQLPQTQATEEEVTAPLWSKDVPTDMRKRYVQEELLGVGRLGMVYRARDLLLRRTVALKIMHPELVSQPELSQQFVDEAQTAARLQHPNILPIYEMGKRDDGCHYFTMQQVKGQSFLRKIQAVHVASDTHRWLPAADGTTFRSLVQAMHRIAVTIAYVHAQGIIYRGLRPDNVMIVEAGEILLVDWGHAATLALGSQLEGFSSDVHALGAILRAILSGSVEVDRPLSRSRCPEVLVAICDKALARAYPSAEAVAEAILGWLQGAERRDRALAEVAGADRVREEADEQARIAASRWSEAQELMETEGVGYAPAWDRWEESRKAADREQLLRQQHRQGLLGALIHTPTLLEAHRPLAWLCLDELVRLAARGEQGRIEPAQQRLEQHLRHLPQQEQARTREVLQARIADGITRQRARRGDLIGREKILREIVSIVRRGGRLLSLVGTAGVGKTQVALEAAERLRADFRRVVFCDLSDAADMTGILRQSAAALDVHLKQDGMGRLTQALQAAPTLLVFDNLEQVAEQASLLCLAWLQTVPSLRILITSRVKLGLGEEQIVPVLPLSMLASIELFVKRGQAVNRHVALCADNRALVSTLVQQFDRLPLAIELAAARLRVLSLSEISARLNERFTLLRSSGPALLDLQDALDWSWDLLEPWARGVLSQISQFHGGFQIGAAEAVVSLEHWPDSPSVYQVLEELSDNSLLQRTLLESGQMRYRMLESVRAYAARKLDSDGKTEGVRARHAAYFARLSQDLSGAPRIQDLDNFVAGLGYGDRDTAPQCCLAALQIISMRGPVSQGIEIIEQVLQIAGLSPHVVARLEVERSKYLRIGGHMAEARTSLGNSQPPSQTPQPDGLDHVEGMRLLQLGHLEHAQGNLLAAENAYLDASQILRALDELDGAADAFHGLGIVHRDQQRVSEARARFMDALHIARKTGDARSEARTLEELGALEYAQGNTDQARAHLLRALHSAQSSGDRGAEGQHLVNLGTIALEQGNTDQARAHYSSAIRIVRDIGDRRSEGIQLGNLGNLECELGNVEQALAHYDAAIQIARELGDHQSEGISLGNLGELLLEQGRLAEAEDALRASIERCDAVFPLASGALRGTLARLLAGKGRLEEAVQLITEGERTISPHRLERGKFLCCKARVLHHAGDAEAAQACLDEAQQISEEFRLMTDSGLAGRIVATSTLLGAAPVPERRQDRTQWQMEGRRLLEVGRIARAQLRYKDAEAAYKEASEIFRGAKSRLRQAEVLKDLGSLAFDQGEAEQARSYFVAALQIAQTIRTRDLEGIVLCLLGLLERAQGNIDAARTHYTRAIDILRELGDRSNEGKQLGNFAILEYEQGNIEEARTALTRALHISREVGDRRNEGVQLGNLATLACEQGSYALASTHYSDAIRIARELGDRKSEGINLGNLGDMLFLQGRTAEAEAAFCDSIALCDAVYPLASGLFRGLLARMIAPQGRLEEASRLIQDGEPMVASHQLERGKFLCSKALVGFHAGDLAAARQTLALARQIAGELKVSADSGLAEEIKTTAAMLEAAGPAAPEDATALDLLEGHRQLELGELEQAQCRYEEAEQAYRKAEVRFRRAGELGLVAEALAELGSVYLTQSRFDHAEAALREAHQLSDGARDQKREGKILGNLGNLARARGDLAQAREHYSSALRILRLAGARRFEGEVMGSLGGVERRRGNTDRARQLFTDALHIARDVGDRRSEARRLGEIGMLAHVEGHVDQARAHVSDAIAAFRALGDRRSESIHIGNLGLIEVGQGRTEQARSLYRMAVHIARELSDMRLESAYLGNLGNLESASGNLAQAREHYNSALHIIQELGDRRSEGITLGNLGELLLTQGEDDAAEDALRRSIEISDVVYPMAGGAFRGILARLLAQSARVPEAEALIAEGQPLVSPHRLELGKFLCSKAQVQFWSGALEAAAASLQQARQIATALAVRPGSDLRRKIIATEQLLRSRST